MRGEIPRGGERIEWIIYESRKCPGAYVFPYDQSGGWKSYNWKWQYQSEVIIPKQERYSLFL